MLRQRDTALQGGLLGTTHTYVLPKQQGGGSAPASAAAGAGATSNSAEDVELIKRSVEEAAGSVSGTRSLAKGGEDSVLDDKARKRKAEGIASSQAKTKKTTTFKF